MKKCLGLYSRMFFESNNVYLCYEERTKDGLMVFRIRLPKVSSYIHSSTSGAFKNNQSFKKETDQCKLLEILYGIL